MYVHIFTCLGVYSNRYFWLSHDIKNKGPLIRWPLGHLVII